MSKIDERVVAMKFNNSQFEKGVADTNKSLDNLKKGLNLEGAAKGLSSLATMGKNFTLGGIASGVDTIASKFSALSIIGITALTNIANKAVNVGTQLVKSLTIEPVNAGFAEYELKMGSIQTILANTARHGTGLDQVTASLEELNTYADKTIYNFGDMTKNIGLFTNAGIKVDDAASMIKGFSNAAAASGTSAQGAAGAAYQLSQALSAGTIRLMDWRSLTNVGMGNKNMQNGLIEIADAMGTLEANSITATDVQGDFNGSLEKNWLSADVMSSYLKIMAGDMTAAEQAALGLSDAQVAAFAKQALTAEEAATKVRTWTQLIGTMQEGVGSGWAQTFDILVGDFDKATEMWTKVNDTLGPIIAAAGDARNKLLQGWADGGGREAALQGIGNAFSALMKIMEPVTQAFREIFPPITVSKLLAITAGFRDFTASLVPSELTLTRIGLVAKGFFAVLDIGWMIIKQVFGLLGRLGGAAAEGGEGFLSAAAKIGGFLVRVRDAIKDGTALGTVFKVIGDVIFNVVAALKKMGQATIDFVDVGSWVQLWENVGNALKKVWEFLAPVGDWFVQAFGVIKNAVSEAFKAMDPSLLVGLLNVGVLGGIGLMIKKFIDSIPGLFGGIGGGIFDTIKGAFGELTNTMGAMQDKLRAEVLTKIAIAIALLTASVVALSFIDTAKLFTSLGAMTIMFGQLSAMMLLLEKSFSPKGISKIAVISASMILLAGAMVILSAAVAIMSTMDWNELARGLTGLAVGMGILGVSAELLSKRAPELAKVGGPLILIATAMVILAAAVKIMSSLSWDEIGRGMTVFAGSMGILIGAVKLLGTSGGGVGAMIALATGMLVLSVALKVFATMSWEELAKGLVVLAGSLLIMAGAAKIMTSAIPGAAAMVVVAGALVILSGVLKVFATMSWEDIGQAMVVLAGSLLILSGAMALMGIPLVLLGAAGLLAASFAMMMLAPALVLLGSMSWDMIGAGLAMLASALGILAVGGVLLLPAIPAFLGLGAAIFLIGAGAMMASVGLTGIALAITTLAAAGTLGAQAFQAALLIIVAAIPAAMAAFAQGLLDFALVIASGGVQITAAFVTIIQSMLDAINTVAP